MFSSLIFLQEGKSSAQTEPKTFPQPFPRSLINSWELEESQTVHGGYPVHLLSYNSSSSSISDSALLLDILHQEDKSSLPSLLFLTHRQLWILKIDFRVLAERQRSNTDLHHAPSSWCKLIRVPLSSVCLHPIEKGFQDVDGTSSICPDPKHQYRYVWFLVTIANLFTISCKPYKL